MNHSAQVYLIAPTAVDGRAGGGVFCGGHWSTHRRMHACTVRVCCRSHSTALALPAAWSALLQQLDVSRDSLHG